ncbi:hypothetical protein WT26_25465 [Burkholderia cepacia]|uniref:Aldo/keto reductase n=2 Tax=Burkholderia cepacia complex TaxID=87882 RepID=A0A1B4PZF4_BURCE|nr:MULTISPECIES: hypothetical protein [Burkholderia cepacia complex]AOK19283.1 hypothetical protein WT26_25465 [Burkholderia cepacia]
MPSTQRTEFISRNTSSQTGLLVSEICLSNMTFGGNEHAGMWKVIGALEKREVDAVVGTALKVGANFIDTADACSFGAFEQRLGQALRILRIAMSGPPLPATAAHQGGVRISVFKAG